MEINNMTSSTTIAMQEEAMWADYFAEQTERLARIPAEEEAAWDQYLAEQQKTAQPEDSVDKDVSITVLETESIYGRFTITALGPAHLYPTDEPIVNPIYGPTEDKQKHTSKDRRYVHLVKVTDRGKALGKTPGRKDKSYRQLKQEGIPLGSF